ncbi:tRNA-uridine aminocarboxypropyltransferase [Salinicola avicenniae]|uniref:tRNA-uridine aminocarboxypropyltransferase n=1 Tax=Salinicola avicenniae TaxID=2916836 RepID=UPI00207498DF|nr:MULTISPECIES: tRNA-uridine aminocarboxypropyltransferase [unclassified Salinicola]
MRDDAEFPAATASADASAPACDAATERDPGTGQARPAGREFKARGSFVERCDGCRLPVLNCLCPYRVSASSDIRVWLLTHPYEHNKPTNTGRLIADVLPQSEIFTWYRTAPDARLLERLADRRFVPFVVFPDDQPDYQHRVVDERAVTSAREDGFIPVFILIDGTWRQARRIFRKSPYLENLPVLPLHTDRLTRYRLRKPASASHLCTAEVAAELLRKSGEGNAADVLDDYFDVFNESYAASRIYHKLDRPTAAMQRLLARRATGSSSLQLFPSS